jgi:hypothetical protein
MSTIENDLNNSNQFVKTHAASAPTIDELFDTWRVQNPAESDAAATRASLNDLDSGERGVPIEDFNKSIAEKHKLSKIDGNSGTNSSA